MYVAERFAEITLSAVVNNGRALLAIEWVTTWF